MNYVSRRIIRGEQSNHFYVFSAHLNQKQRQRRHISEHCMGGLKYCWAYLFLHKQVWRCSWSLPSELCLQVCSDLRASITACRKWGRRMRRGLKEAGWNMLHGCESTFRNVNKSKFISPELTVCTRFQKSAWWVNTTWSTAGAVQCFLYWSEEWKERGYEVVGSRINVLRLEASQQMPRTKTQCVTELHNPFCPPCCSSYREAPDSGYWVFVSLSNTPSDRPHVNRAIYQEALLLIFFFFIRE